MVEVAEGGRYVPMRGRNIQAPVAEAVKRYAGNNIIRFHMPGHKGGQGISAAAKEILGKKVYELDITGVEGMDDLLQPTGIIKEAEKLLAQAFGAEESFFLVNGTSSGLQVLMLPPARPGRNLRRAICITMVAGLVLMGHGLCF